MVCEGLGVGAMETDHFGPVVAALPCYGGCRPPYYD
jgi:hypothetical protein